MGSVELETLIIQPSMGLSVFSLVLEEGVTVLYLNIIVICKAVFKSAILGQLRWGMKI